MKQSLLGKSLLGLIIVGVLSLVAPMPAFACGPSGIGLALIGFALFGLPIVAIILIFSIFTHDAPKSSPEHGK